MIEPGNSFRHRCHGRNLRDGGPFEHEYGNAQRPGRRNLAVSCLSPTVLGDHGVDGKRLQKRSIPILRKRAASKDVVHIRRGKWRFHGIDASNNVVMLRCRVERNQLLAPDSQKYAPGARAQRAHRLFGTGNIDPSVSIYRCPGGPAQSQQRSVGSRCSCSRVRGNSLRIGMRGIDQEIHLIGAQKLGKSINTAKAAPADRNWLRSGRDRPTGKRNGRGEVTLGKRESKLAGLRSTSQNQYVWTHGRQP